eukprot:scaffold266061_cov19-Tisochrysis_lutea.AAC.1
MHECMALAGTGARMYGWAISEASRRLKPIVHKEILAAFLKAGPECSNSNKQLGEELTTLSRIAHWCSGNDTSQQRSFSYSCMAAAAG